MFLRVNYSDAVPEPLPVAMAGPSLHHRGIFGAFMDVAFQPSRLSLPFSDNNDETKGCLQRHLFLCLYTVLCANIFCFAIDLLAPSFMWGVR